MSEDERVPILRAAFDNARQDLKGEAFTARVMSQTDTLRRRTIVRRILIGLAVSLLAIPLKDAAIPMTQILVLSLVDLNDRFLAEVLAPVNSVGTLLSLVLLGLRIAHKRLFS